MSASAVAIDGVTPLNVVARRNLPVVASLLNLHWLSESECHLVTKSSIVGGVRLSTAALTTILKSPVGLPESFVSSNTSLAVPRNSA